MSSLLRCLSVLDDTSAINWRN